MLKYTFLDSHGHCCWPGCDCSCPDVSAFQRHLSTAHVLDDKSTAQTRVQVQIVTQLELQLNKERDKLDAMMAHLRLDNRNGELVPRTSSFERRRSRSPRSVYSNDNLVSCVKLRKLQSCVTTLMLSSDNHPQNVPLATQKRTMAQFF